MFHYCPLPTAPVQSSNTFMNDSTTPLGCPPFSPIHYIQSPVLVPPASVCLPSHLGSRMNVHPNIDRTPSRIMHQPPPHQIVDLDHILASAHLIPEIQSAPAVMSDFPREHYPMAPENHPYPMYYTPYPVYQAFPPPDQPRSTTPRFKIEYSSIHATFLATIKDTDSLKDRKSWVKWNEGVWQAVAGSFVIGHICDEPQPGIPRTKWNTPSLRPTISSNPTRKELET
ncbi:hypothetical protein F5876DRAFT_82299 [Lentinula aff. lateritia]|uniref:Uncharacterized protein n=1 Tax=Lentinula aff. lateritia TaxID=2804960 RepID=A0ACC1TKU4_9AGAR|nr:hypothetical protein F5876DRAFT_82299 [Lentinula aff. lateritia]